MSDKDIKKVIIAVAKWMENNYPYDGDEVADYIIDDVHHITQVIKADL